MHRITNEEEAHNIILRLADFIGWSKQNNVNQQSYMKCVEAYLQIINREGINLDAEFNHDQMERVLEFYTYNEDVADSDHPNLEPFLVRRGTVENIAETYQDRLELHKDHLNKYREFCVAINPPNM